MSESTQRSERAGRRAKRFLGRVGVAFCAHPYEELVEFLVAFEHARSGKFVNGLDRRDVSKELVDASTSPGVRGPRRIGAACHGRSSRLSRAPVCQDGPSRVDIAARFARCRPL